MASKFSLEAIFRAVDKISAPIVKIQGNLARFGRAASQSLGALDQKLGTIHAGFKRVGMATAALGAAGGLAAYSIGKAGAEFEAAMSAVGAVGLETREQIADLEAKAKQLGATTKFTATQAANAMEIMRMAGFSNADVLAGIGPVLDAAAASGLEIAEVANHVSNALKGMGLETSEAGRVADVLAVASARTNSSIGSLGESLSNVASTARQFNIPLEEVVAGVALLQDVGLDASVAGSALNTMLTQMANPTDEVAAKMKKFGVSFQDAQGNMLPFQQVLANVSKAAAKSGGNMDQVAFFAELVGLRGQKAAANLKDLFNTGRVEALTNELQNAEGAAKKMAAIRMDNTIGDLTLLESAVDGLKVALFETQGGPLRRIIQSMTKWVDVNKDLIVFEFQVWLRRIQNNLPAIVTWLKRIGVAAVAFYTFAAAVKVARATIWAFEVAAKAAGLAARLWSAAVAACTAVANSAALATARLKIAMVASRAVTLVATASQWAYSAQLNMTTVASVRLKVAEVATKIATLATRAATVIATAAQGAYAAALALSTGGLGAFRLAALASVTAIGAQLAALAPFLVTLAAATAAVTALVKAWEQYNALDKDLAGSGGIAGTVGKMVEMGTWDPFEAHDAVLNEKAQEQRRERDDRDRRGEGELARTQMISPQARAAATATVGGTITVEATPGTKATAKTRPKSPPLIVKPSGAF